MKQGKRQTKQKAEKEIWPLFFFIIVYWRHQRNQLVAYKVNNRARPDLVSKAPYQTHRQKFRYLGGICNI